ncbi:MAG: HmuY family protein [Spirochaetia bacterium]|nr:HmuY family protein [Spirochaetia bacterium]
MRAILFLTLFLIPAACLYDKKGNYERDQLFLLLVASTQGGACTSTGSSGSFTAEVDASSSTAWTQCDFATGLAVSGASNAWELRFQRFKVGSNGGVSGSGNAAVCTTGQTNFASVTNVSGLGGTCQFTIDTNVTGAAAGGTATAFTGNSLLVDWYNYDQVTHILSAKSDVYIVRSGEAPARYYKFQMLDYYNSSGISGFPKLRWSEVTF